MTNLSLQVTKGLNACVQDTIEIRSNEQSDIDRVLEAFTGKSE